MTTLPVKQYRLFDIYTSSVFHFSHYLILNVSPTLSHFASIIYSSDISLQIAFTLSVRFLSERFASVIFRFYHFAFRDARKHTRRWQGAKGVATLWLIDLCWQ